MDEWEKRPDPEVLLSSAQEESRGKLKLFLGSAPGVGKTFAMLTEAQEKRKQNLDVVVGWVDTHKRRETEALLHGLEVIPRLKVEINGYFYEHLDVKAIIKRRPATVVIDEMPHSNPPGAHHAKRWQDIEEILDVGINVYSALNIQHLESLNGVVSRVTGVQVSETIPDSVFDRADEVRLVDLPPDDLILRLEAGKIYLPEVVDRARSNYFKRSNLIALRDLTLRAMASRIDSEIKSSRMSSSSRDVEDTSFGLILVLEDVASPDAIRETARVARALSSPWHCVWIGEIEEQLSSDAIDLLQFAHDLGATTDNLGGEFCQTICDYVRDHNLSLVVFLQSMSIAAFWRRHKLALAAPELKFMTLSHHAQPWSVMGFCRSLFSGGKRKTTRLHKSNSFGNDADLAGSGRGMLALGTSTTATAKIKTASISAGAEAKAAASAVAADVAAAVAEAEVARAAAAYGNDRDNNNASTAISGALGTAGNSAVKARTGKAAGGISVWDNAAATVIDSVAASAVAEAEPAAEAPAKTEIVKDTEAENRKAAEDQGHEAGADSADPKEPPKIVRDKGVKEGERSAKETAGQTETTSGSDIGAEGVVRVATVTKGGSVTLAPNALSTAAEPVANSGCQSRLKGLWQVVVCNILMTSLLLPLSDFLAPTNLVMFYLLITLFIATRYGYYAATLSSVISVLCFDLTMVNPIGSFAVQDLQYLITFTAMLVIGLTTARLVSHRQSMMNEARKRESQTRMLYDAARYLSFAIDEDSVYSIISRIFSQGMSITVEFWRYYEDDNEIVRKQLVLKNVDEAIVRWCLERKKPAGMGTHTLNQSSYLYLPLIGSENVLGVVVMKLKHSKQWSDPSSYRLMQGLITLSAQAIDRLESVDDARQTLMNMEAERLRHSLIQSLSHDLRTPLTAILANAENLSNKLKCGQGNSAAAQAEGEALVLSTQRMVRLMTNVMEMAKLQTDQLVLNKQWIPSEELIGMSRTTLKERLSRFNVKVEIEPDCPPLYGDVVLLDRLLSNLLDNATKYCPEGSTIVIEVKRRADKVGLAVLDNGPGIKTDNPQRLFDPFKRGQKESKVVGIGLGLAICKTIARVHDADLFVIPSRLGGACFMLALPYVPLPELEDDPLFDDEDSAEAGKILTQSADAARAAPDAARATADAAQAAPDATANSADAGYAPVESVADASSAAAQVDAGTTGGELKDAEESANEILHKARVKIQASIDYRKNSYLREFGLAEEPYNYHLTGALSSNKDKTTVTDPAGASDTVTSDTTPS